MNLHVLLSRTFFSQSRRLKSGGKFSRIANRPQAWASGISGFKAVNGQILETGRTF